MKRNKVFKWPSKGFKWFFETYKKGEWKLSEVGYNKSGLNTQLKNACINDYLKINNDVFEQEMRKLFNVSRGDGLVDEVYDEERGIIYNAFGVRGAWQNEEQYAMVYMIDYCNKEEMKSKIREIIEEHKKRNS